jgi:hypothetical protein
MEFEVFIQIKNDLSVNVDYCAKNEVIRLPNGKTITRGFISRKIEKCLKEELEKEAANEGCSSHHS